MVTAGVASPAVRRAARGTAYDIPPGWERRVADNGKGIVFQRPGATGNADMIKIMEPTTDYPHGYARVYDSYGQPIDVLGEPASRAATHHPETYGGLWGSWSRR